MRSVRPGGLVKDGECTRIEGRPGDSRPAVCLCIVAQALTIRFCRESCFDTRSQRLPFAGSRRPARVTSYTCSCEASPMP